ncbi:hypothetical protein AURDEDRAFT_177283 [Auricularia subglabra TFB-10046 SS5]|uniref:Uncharacterized protein n=1 Tax=Auricularia subglabra (strain TFB-10046 / SS5) TaxID=717982 RepID=J0D4G7_AURST|nr:hypothetical protein AURDEDRAFT_177283 [Auricularia subglabra TFB-10046 SS5]
MVRLFVCFVPVADDGSTPALLRLPQPTLLRRPQHFSDGAIGHLKRVVNTSGQSFRETGIIDSNSVVASPPCSPHAGDADAETRDTDAVAAASPPRYSVPAPSGWPVAGAPASAGSQIFTISSLDTVTAPGDVRPPYAVR